MFFFNGRIRDTHIVPIIARDRAYTHRISEPGIIFGCLLVIIGLILIIIGSISETDKATYYRIGITSLSLGFFFSILLCSYTKLGICYHNWAYRSHITPSKIETSIAATTAGISIHYNTDRFSQTSRVSIITIPPVSTTSNI